MNFLKKTKSPLLAPHFFVILEYILIKVFTSRNRQLTRHVSVNILREDDPGGHRQAATLTVTYSASHATSRKQ